MPLQRIVVAGSSGSGKTTTCNRLAARLGLARVEIDSLFHGPYWQPRERFAADVDAFTQGPSWVIEWQYRSVRPLLAARADTLVWLDFRRTTVMTRLVRRTLHRRLRRVELWNGNLEPPLRTFFSDRDHIIRWGWRTHADKPAQVREVTAANPHLEVIVLRNQRDVDRWLESL